MLSPREALWGQLPQPHGQAAGIRWAPFRSVQTAVASTDIADEIGVVGSENVKLFAAVATEEADVHRVA